MNLIIKKSPGEKKFSPGQVGNTDFRFVILLARSMGDNYKGVRN